MHEYAPTSSGERDTQVPTGRGQPDQIVHREQDRAALTDNHRDGVHGILGLPPDSASCFFGGLMLLCSTAGVRLPTALTQPRGRA